MKSEWIFDFKQFDEMGEYIYAHRLELQYHREGNILLNDVKSHNLGLKVFTFQITYGLILTVKISLVKQDIISDRRLNYLISQEMPGDWFSGLVQYSYVFCYPDAVSHVRWQKRVAINYFAIDQLTISII